MLGALARWPGRAQQRADSARPRRWAAQARLRGAAARASAAVPAAGAPGLREGRSAPAQLSDEQMRKLQSVELKYERQRFALLRDERQARLGLKSVMDDSASVDQARLASSSR